MNSLRIQELLERLASLVRSESRAHLAQLGLLPVQFEVLHYLSVCNRYSDTPMAVTDFLGQTKGTVSQTLKVLEKKGLIAKTPDAQDKRVTHMAVTEAGRALLDRLLPSPLLTAGLAELSEDKAQNLEGSLKNLLRGLQRQNRFKSFGQCATCIHNANAGAGQYLCKLTGEALTQSETQLICREHEYPSA